MPCSYFKATSMLCVHLLEIPWKESGKVELVPVFTLCFNMQDNTKVCGEAPPGPFWYPYSLSYTTEHPTFPLASPSVTLNSSCKIKDWVKKERKPQHTLLVVFQKKSRTPWLHLPSSEGTSHLGHDTIFPLEARCSKYQTAF